MTENLCPVCRLREPYRPWVCDACRIRLPIQLHEISLLYTVLPAALADRPGSIVDLTLPPVGGASINSVLDTQGDQGGLIPVTAVLLSWVDDWAEQRGEDTTGITTVFRAAQWLHHRLDWAMDTQDAVGDFASEVRATLASVRRAIGRDLSPVRFAAPCPHCLTPTLVRHPGADWIECQSCRRLWDESEYAWLARASLDPDERLTIHEAALMATSVRGKPVAPATIRVWVHRGRLVAEHDDNGRTWVRKGDVEEAAGTVVMRR